MSADAERYVAACTNPKVKGGARALLAAIARHIPEGQTATPPLTLPDLAIAAQCTARTAWSNRKILEAEGELQVHDGGRGKVARYEMLRLIEGARPATAAPLPLRADLREAKPRRTKEERSTSDLFSDVEPPTSEVSSYVGSIVVANIGSFFIRWWSAYERTAINVGNFFRRWTSGTNEQRSTSAISSDVAAPLSSSYVRTEGVVDARAREPADAFLDWFEATYPIEHDGAVCSVPRSRDRPLVCALLERPRTDVAHLQVMTRLLWTVTSDGVVNSDRWWIGERVSVRNIFVLHRKADFLDRAVRQRETAAAHAEDGDDLRREVEQRLGRDWRKSG